MKRKALLWTTNLVMVVLLTTCMVSGAHARQRHRADGVPSPWTSTDIGNVGTTGTATSDGDNFTVQGSGSDIWSTADNFQYVYQPLAGDGQLFARINSQSGASPWAKAGIMIRETLDPGSPNVLLSLTPAHGISFQWRSTAGQTSNYRAGPAADAPYWVKLVRQGDVITGFASQDGHSWTEVNNVTLAMPTSIYIGLAVTSHDDNDVNEVSFSNVGPSSNPVPPGQPPFPPQNLALNGSVNASSSDPAHQPENTIDGDGSTYWSNAANDVHPWINVDLGADYPVWGVNLTWLDNNSRTYDIQGSQDGNTWTTLETLSNDTQQQVKIDLKNMAKKNMAKGKAGTPATSKGVNKSNNKGNKPGTVKKAGIEPNAPFEYYSFLSRYIRVIISQNQGQVYKLAEIEVYGTLLIPPGPQGPSGAINLALNRPATSSSSQDAPQNAVDDDLGTRWTSTNGNGSEWLQVDLGATYAINEVKLYWNSAYADAYQVQVSDDASTWRWIYSTTNGGGDLADLTGLSGSGRYIRVYMTGRTDDNANFSIAEFQVFGSAVGPQGPEGDVGPQGPQGTSGAINLALNPYDCSASSEANNPDVLKGNTKAGTQPKATPHFPNHPSSKIRPKSKIKPNTGPSGTFDACNAFDGNLNTYWASETSNSDQWLRADLYGWYNINEVKLDWGAQFATHYIIQGSNDDSTWNTIYENSDGHGGSEDLTGLNTWYGFEYIRLFIPGVTNSTFAVKEFQVFGTAVGPEGPQGPSGTIDLSVGRSATSSSDASSTNNSQRAVDNDLTTRWESNTTNTDQWLRVDLGNTFYINQVRLYWYNNESASNYRIEDSTDGTNWTQLYGTTTGGGGKVDLNGLNGTGRYIRVYINSSSSATFSLWEFQVFGDPAIIP